MPHNPSDEQQSLLRLVHFIHEVGMLRRTPRTGYQFLGTGSENVAEHSHRTAVIGYILAHMAAADTARTVLLCLFHDLPEARTGDFNYVNHIYNTSNARLALEHATDGTGLGPSLLGMWQELNDANSTEALLAHDADQLDLIFNLQCEFEKGNNQATAWMQAARQRLKTEHAQKLADIAMHTPSDQWWHYGVDRSWWENRQ